MSPALLHNPPSKAAPMSNPSELPDNAHAPADASPPSRSRSRLTPVLGVIMLLAMMLTGAA